MEDQARAMAERIARRIGGGSGAPADINSEVAAIRESINELQSRLVQIEAKLGAPRVQSPWHPSQDRFGVDEATVTELVDFFQNEKACSLEAEKACDHCAMCSSRGF
jgi:hypothetical protein